MKVQHFVLGALVACAFGPVLAQTPKASQPAVCNNCHQPAPGLVAAVN